MLSEENNVDHEASTDKLLDRPIRLGTRAAIKTPPTNSRGLSQTSFMATPKQGPRSGENGGSLHPTTRNTYLRDQSVTINSAHSQDRNSPAFVERPPLRSPRSHSWVLDAWRIMKRPMTVIATASSSRAKSCCGPMAVESLIPSVKVFTCA
jgi:hypothetical protein